MDYMVALSEILDIMRKLATYTCKLPSNPIEAVYAYDMIIEQATEARGYWHHLVDRGVGAKEEPPKESTTDALRKRIAEKLKERENR